MVSYLLLQVPSSLPVRILIIIFWALTASIASSFKIDESAGSASSINANDNNADGDATNLFAWARQHGAKIADSIEVKSTPYGGRGLFAKSRIPANTELILIPYHLQLGVRQLAEGADEEMQEMARNLPWEYIRQNELFFVPLSIALIAEKRKMETDSSIFGPFLQSLPQHCPNAIGTVSEGEDGNDNLSDLLLWAPNVANKVQCRRNGLQSLHKAIAPPSISIEDLRWAASNVCSRSLVRKRIKELTTDQVERIGKFASSDHSRMLPVIDLVNHGSLQSANVWVGHLPHGGDGDDYDTSLKSTRDIEAGEELLFDYGGGGGEMISNDRLLLDYGFVLPGHTDRVLISLEEFDAAISELESNMVGMKDVPQKDIEGLHALITFLIKQASKTQDNASLIFTGTGEPSMQTLAVAAAMTCRDHDDVTRVLKPVHEITPQHDASLLPTQIVESCTDLQREFARYALKRAVGLALVQKLSKSDVNNNREGEECDMDSGKEAGKFVNVAREYSAMYQKMLQEVSDMSR